MARNHPGTLLGAMASTFRPSRHPPRRERCRRARSEQRLVQRDAEAELVRARVDRLAPELLGRHVRGRADDRAGLGHDPDRQGRLVLAGLARVAATSSCASRARPKSMTRTEPSFGDHHVLRLEVAVDDARGVRRRQAAPRRDEHVEDLLPGPRLGAQPLVDRVSARSSSIAMNTRSPNVPASWTVTTFGCDSRAMARASRSSRARRSPVPAPSPCTTFRAMRRSRSGW